MPCEQQQESLLLTATQAASDADSLVLTSRAAVALCVGETTPHSFRGKKLSTFH